MNPIFTSLGDRELRITLDAESDWYKELINIGKANGSFTLEHDGHTVFGCKVDTVAICASGNGGTLADIVVKLPPATPFLRTAIVHTKYRLKSDGHNEELQNRLFELGAKWKTKGSLATTPRKIRGNYLYVSKLGNLTHSNSYTRFVNGTGTELNYRDLLDIQQGRAAGSNHDAFLKVEKQRRLAEMYGMGDARLRDLNKPCAVFMPGDDMPQGTVTGRWSGKEPSPCGDPCDMNDRSYFVNKGRRAGKTIMALDDLEKRVLAYYGTPTGASHFYDMYQQAITTPLTGDELRGSIMKNNWKFDSVHPKDIDFDELTGAVTRHFPIAIVKGTYTEKVSAFRPVRTADGNFRYTDGTVRNEAGELLVAQTVATGRDVELQDAATKIVEPYTRPVKRYENYLVVHKTLIDKAFVINMQIPEGKTPWRANGNGSRVFKGITTAQLSAWIKWAKDVKAAKWDDEDRRKVTFEVNLVSV